MTDPMSPEELRACREHAEAACVTGYAPSRVCEKGTRSCGVRHYRTADVPRLLATIDAAQRETASLRHAALFAAGVRGGPGAWRWASDPTGTILDDEAAWERLLGEMRERASNADWSERNAPEEPAERKPVAGWKQRSEKWWTLRTPPGEAWAFTDGSWTHIADGEGLQQATSLKAAQFAAEDALFAIADAIKALRGRE